MCYNMYIFCDEFGVVVKLLLLESLCLVEVDSKNLMNLSNEQLGNSVINKSV